MNLLHEFVTKAIQNKPELGHLRHVVEKEILHHDILLIMSQNGLMKNLTFRVCQKIGLFSWNL